jgi:hypothetical protein
VFSSEGRPNVISIPYAFELKRNTFHTGMYRQLLPFELITESVILGGDCSAEAAIT